MQLAWRHGLNSADRADGHEDGRLDVAVVRRKDAAAAEAGTVVFKNLEHAYINIW